MKIALGIEYLGTNYHGWQRQLDVISVQAVVEAALSKIAQQEIVVFCSGRTDKGVHAKCQTIHFETEAKRDISAWVLGTNTLLPDDIKVLWAKPMPADFHARFSAKKRVYQYLIYCRPVRSAIYYKHAKYHSRPLDLAKMQQAANYFIGEHDFSALRASGCQAKSPTRTIEYLNIKQADDFISLDIAANGFLHHMVRNIVGVLLPIGDGKKSVSWAKEVLLSKDRRMAGVTEDPEGLYFVRAEYDKIYSL